MRFAAPGHGEHFAVKELALEPGGSFQGEIFGFGQPMNWLSQAHDNERLKKLIRASNQ